MAPAMVNRGFEQAEAQGSVARAAFEYREVAKILRVHPTEALLELLKSVMPATAANEMWLVREIETERGELLVNETGQWL